MSYRVYVNGNVVAHETTIASAKALVTGLKAYWAIAYTSKEFASIGIVGNNGKIQPMFASEESKKFLKTFVRSRAEKEVNNTTYLTCEEFQKNFGEKMPIKKGRKIVEKLLELCGF